MTSKCMIGQSDSTDETSLANQRQYLLFRPMLDRLVNESRDNTCENHG